MEKSYPCLFAGIKINIVLVSRELQTTIPPKDCNFLFKLIFPYLSKSSRCFFLQKNHSKIISNTNTIKLTKNIQTPEKVHEDIKTKGQKL